MSEYPSAQLSLALLCSLAEEIDIDLARTQHRAYCAALEDAGLGLRLIAPDERFPDCCFVEDTSIVLGGTAIMTVMGAPSRVGEEEAVREVLADYLAVKEIARPATLDGGDVLVIGRDVFIGLGERTNEAGVEQVRALAGPDFRITPVPLKGVLHLKSACTYVGDGHILIRPGHFDADAFRGFKLIEVPEGEAYAANCLSLGSVVLVSAGYPRTRDAVEARGFRTRSVEMSEFRKGHGSLTCLSKIF
jgi:dimethylargininase